MQIMNAKDFKPTSDMIHAAQTVFLCMAMVETIKPIVTGYQKAILNKYQFKVASDKVNRGHDKDEIILDPDKSYLLDDSDSQVYIEETFRERDRAGLKVSNPEFCPLLVAEHNLTKAQHILIRSMEPLTGVTLDQILCGRNCLVNLKKYIELSLRLLAPFVKNPLKSV